MVPVKLIAVRLQTTSPTKVGISASANATLLPPGSREVALIVSVDGRTVRTEHVLLRHGKVPDFLVTRLVPVSNGVHLVTLSVLAGSEEMDGIEIVSSGLRTAEGEIPRWARPGE